MSITAMLGDTAIVRLLLLLSAHEERSRQVFHFTPPENSMSPLARLPFVLDGYSRYYFHGKYNFHGARELGAIEQEILIPTLQAMARARHVNVRPLSGLNCMTAAIAALCRPGETVVTVPVESGGHMSTRAVIGRLGARVDDLPMADPHEVDLDGLAAYLADHRPALVYLDQSSQLFPIDPRPIRDLLDRLSPSTRIHCDSSHLNGIILAGECFNPLERGADCFGGSTHKTLPGPHKAFLATNSDEVAQRLHPYLEDLISQHQLAGIASLAITLLELQHCGGREYAANVLENARCLATCLDERGFDVAAKRRGFTACHQVWMALPEAADVASCVERLHRCGLVVNSFPGLPGIPRPALRLSVAEVTRLGADRGDMAEFADIFADAIRGRESEARMTDRVLAMRARLSAPRYCADIDDLVGSTSSPRLRALAAHIQELVTAAAAPERRTRPAARVPL